MKKIYLIMFFLFSINAYANTPYGIVMLNGFGDSYLVNAANAWSGITPGIGKSGALASGLNNKFSSNIFDFRNAMSAIAYNESPIKIFETITYLDNAFSIISQPLDAQNDDCNPIRNNKCQKKSININGKGFAGISKFESGNNGDFKTERRGVNINAEAYTSNNMTLGVGFTRNTTNTKDRTINNDAITNGFNVFARYVSSNDMFVNTGFVFANTNWESEKSILGLIDSDQHNSNFFSGQIIGGKKIGNRDFFLTPSAGMRYTYLSSESHTDDALQNFDSWNHKILAGIAQVRMGTEFVQGGFSFVPNLFIGGGYDIMTSGNDNINVTLSDGSGYQMPVESPDAGLINAGLGFSFISDSVIGGLEYRLDSRQKFISHNIMLSIKAAF